jgi:ligand-binding SRPBCC domain-containing protein
MYALSNTQALPVSKNEAWEFLSNPTQLENITSDDVGFKPVGEIHEKMYEGMLMHYQIRPILGIRFNWVTEITHIEEGRRFIDEQRFGPFRFWHHEHQLVEDADGVIMKDLVHYVMPFSVLGRATHALFVRKMLEDIFRERTKIIETYFG